MAHLFQIYKLFKQFSQLKKKSSNGMPFTPSFMTITAITLVVLMSGDEHKDIHETPQVPKDLYSLGYAFHTHSSIEARDHEVN
jgi:hypothetical protein